MILTSPFPIAIGYCHVLPVGAEPDRLVFWASDPGSLWAIGPPVVILHVARRPHPSTAAATLPSSLMPWVM